MKKIEKLPNKIPCFSLSYFIIFPGITGSLEYIGAQIN
jgi:hypothetical protein